MGQVGTTAQAAEHGQRAPWRVRTLSKHLDLALAAAQVAVDVIMLNLATLFA